MKRIIFTFLVIAVSCSTIPNKSIIEPLTDKELYRALKNKDFALMYNYCFAQNGFDFSELPQWKRVEYMDVSYKSFTEYYMELYRMTDCKLDTLQVIRKWEQLYGNENLIKEQLDSLRNRWKDEMRYSLLYDKQGFLPRSLWYELQLYGKPISYKETLELNNIYNPQNVDPSFLVFEHNIADSLVETFGQYFYDTYFFKESDWAQRFPKESQLFQYCMDGDREPYNWPWAMIYYELYEIYSMSFPPTWKRIDKDVRAFYEDIRKEFYPNSYSYFTD